MSTLKLKDLLINRIAEIDDVHFLNYFGREDGGTNHQPYPSASTRNPSLP